MHPLARNPYRTPPNFWELAQAYPLLQSCLIKHGPSFSIDFRNEISQRRLTEALLHRDFGLSLQLPPNRLYRLNYVLWIESVVGAIPVDSRQVRGMDIGTGASAIYPLLACRTNADWSFIATDIDSLSLQNAQSNIEGNGLKDRVRLFDTTPDAPILAPLLHDPALSITFTMCNPPFYSSHEEVKTSAGAKQFEPNAVCTGAEVEMITPGGESAFVRRMVEESVRIGTRCQWFTSMLGKMSSLSEVVDSLRSHSIDNYAITESVQGTTRRWAIGCQHFPVVPPSPSQTERMRLGQLLADVLTRLDETHGVAGVPPDGTFTVHASKNTWSRSARRKQNQKSSVETNSADKQDTPSYTETCLEHQWMQGKDRQLFEGFASHINRKVAEAVAMV
ncbi:S-adenosyl-L-methionine dependent methyltransferase [Mycena amicta]|nr:S-adenosyl-L-methionine dependent methyltransferase [Mycena amicta]